MKKLRIVPNVPLQKDVSQKLVMMLGKSLVQIQQQIRSIDSLLQESAVFPEEDVQLMKELSEDLKEQRSQIYQRLELIRSQSGGKEIHAA